METLGVVEEVMSDGRIVVRSKALPDIGDSVMDQRERRIGTVKRIFGPVDEPYITVGTDGVQDVLGLKGKTLYYNRGSQNGKGKRRNRRD